MCDPGGGDLSERQIATQRRHRDRPQTFAKREDATEATSRPNRLWRSSEVAWLGGRTESSISAKAGLYVVLLPFL